MRVLGADIGQARDPTALAMLQGLDVLYAERLPLHLPYPDVARRISAVATAAGGATIAIDATGIGRAMVDLLRQDGRKVLAVTISAGQMVRRSGDGATVPKEALLAPLVAAVEQRRLRVSRSCPAAAELLEELATFRRRPDGRIEARGDGHHGDLAIAVALGLFAQGLARVGGAS